MCPPLLVSQLLPYLQVQPAHFEITDSNGTHSVKIHAEAGELVRPASMSPEEYSANEAKLQGMHMSTGSVQLGSKNVGAVVMEFANMSQVDGCAAGEHKFAGTTLSGDKPVLLTLTETPEAVQYRLHVDNAVLGSNLQASLKKAFKD